MVVNAPKSPPVTFINYEDICYSTGNLRASQYYLEHIQPWFVRSDYKFLCIILY